VKTPYLYGNFVCMKKTFNIDEDLIRKAKIACGAATETETIRLGLQALIRHRAYQNTRALLGTEKDALDVPRRREKVVTRRRAS